MLFINAVIHTMDAGVLSNAYLHFENGLILDFGKMQDCNVEDEKTLDLHGLNVYPGFIDAHSHLGLLEDSLGFEGDDINEATDPITPQLRAIDGINPFDTCFKDALYAGVTSVAVSPGSANPIAGQISVIKTHGKRIDDMVIKSPVAIKFALGENPKSTYREKEQLPITRMATAALIYEQLHKAKQYAKNKKKREIDEDGAETPEYDARCEALLPLLEGKIKAHFHAHRTDDIFTAIRIAKDFNLRYAIIHATQGHMIADELRAENATIFSGPILSERCKPELNGLTPQCPSILSNAGLNISIITDHSVIPEQYLTLCAMLAVKEGMKPDEALKAITLYPSIALDIDDRVGSIKIGKDADFVIYDGSPLDFYNKPKMVVSSGEIVFNDI